MVVVVEEIRLDPNRVVANKPFEVYATAYNTESTQAERTLRVDLVLPDGSRQPVLIATIDLNPNERKEAFLGRVAISVPGTYKVCIYELCATLEVTEEGAPEEEAPEEEAPSIFPVAAALLALGTILAIARIRRG